MSLRLGRVQALSLIGLLGGLAAVVSILAVGDTFGFPGSAKYRLYEGFNRLMAVFILLEASAIFALYLHKGWALGGGERTVLLVAWAAWIGMAVGTAAEFWLFSDLPYREPNARSAAFTFFSISSLLAGLALLGLGLRLFFSRKVSRYFSMIMLLYLPVDIALFVGGESIFLASAGAAAALAVATLASSFEAQNPE